MDMLRSALFEAETVLGDAIDNGSEAAARALQTSQIALTGTLSGATLAATVRDASAASAGVAALPRC